MRLLLLAPAALVLLSGAVFAQNVSSPDMPLKPPQHHPSRATHATDTAQAASADDSESRVGQVPANLLGPPGQRIPEVGPPPPKTETTNTPTKVNTADCTSNPDSKECYAATQQGKAK
jgi:hypothetical protein